MKAFKRYECVSHFGGKRFEMYECKKTELKLLFVVSSQSELDLRLAIAGIDEDDVYFSDIESLEQFVWPGN